MNLSELTINLYTNISFLIKNIAKKHNISSSQLLCLHVIPSDGITQSNLADILCVDLSTLSRNLDKLVDKQLIIKNQSSHDKRKQMITMTDTGEKLYINLLNDFHQSLNVLYDELDDSYSIESIMNNMDQFNWLLYKKRY